MCGAILLAQTRIDFKEHPIINPAVSKVIIIGSMNLSIGPKMLPNYGKH